jgi:hypothetical protein
VAYWESAYLRRLAGLNVMPSSFEGCLMQTSQKSGINYLDIFRWSVCFALILIIWML